MTTPTRDELARWIGNALDGIPGGTWAAADVVLPLLAERDAEIERLRDEVEQLGGIMKFWQASALRHTTELDAWRACAELFACSDDEAFDVYDALKGGEQ